MAIVRHERHKGQDNDLVTIAWSAADESVTAEPVYQQNDGAAQQGIRRFGTEIQNAVGRQVSPCHMNM